MAYSHRTPRKLAHASLGLLALGLLAAPSATYAQSFPSKPIRFVVPTGPSTPPDIISRIIATELSESEKWQTVVENRGGAMQSLGTAEVIKQDADGYSILAVGSATTAMPALMPNLSFKVETDLTPLIKSAVAYNMLVVGPTVPVKSVAELVALIKSQPNKLNFSSGGFGTPPHLLGEMFKLEAGLSVTHVPYNQMAQAIGDLLNGTNQYQFIAMPPVVELVNSGKLRGLAVMGPKRVAALPDVPSIVEAGFPKLVGTDWQGFAVKSGTANEIVTKLNAAINKALAKPNVIATLAKLGAEPAGGTPAEFAKLMTSQLAHWGNVIRTAGIKVPQ